MAKLFLRYVMEVIQRGRTVVRPAGFPTLNVVPAVSDTELSQAQYVPLAQFPIMHFLVHYHSYHSP